MSKQTLSDNLGGISVVWVCMSSDPASLVRVMCMWSSSSRRPLSKGWKQTSFPTASSRATRLHNSFVSCGKKVPGVLYSKSCLLLGRYGSTVSSMSLMCSLRNKFSTMTPPSRSRISTRAFVVRRNMVKVDWN
jgi:hypothetical protein